MNDHQRKGPDLLLLGLLAGIVLGALFGGAFPSLAAQVKFLGTLFIHALMVMVVPLIMASMVVGIANLGDVRHLGAIGLRTVAFFLGSTGLAVLVGIVLVYAIRPGEGLSSGESLPEARYRIVENRLVLEGSRFTGEDYDERFVLQLADQPITATLAAAPMAADQVVVERWKEMRWISPYDAAALLNVSEDEVLERVRSKALEGRTDGGVLQVRVAVATDEAGRLIVPRAEGTGLSIHLPVASRVAGKERSIVDVVTDVLVGLVPTNLVQAMAETDVLPLIVFSLFLGAVLSTLGPAGEPVLRVFSGLNDAIMRMVQLLMYTAPVGIFALVAARLGEAGGWAGFLPELARLAKYAFTVILGLGIHGLIVLPLLLAFLGRRQILPFIGGMMPALTTAFSTASSSATIPLTMECLEDNNGVSNRTASFVVPLGATINMNGTALYEAVAAVFIAQMHGIELGGVQLVVVFLTATLAAIGAAGIPEAGLVTMVIVLKAANLPISGITMILVIDWFLDRCRTTVNVWGDAVGAGIIDHYESKDMV